MKKWAALASGPFAFLLTFILAPCEARQASALGLAAWMALWWALRPVAIAVTALLPIAVNAALNLLPGERIISQYFSEIVVLLLGADLISLTWSRTGLDRRVAALALAHVGTSMRHQIFMWLAASVVLSIFLPNVVVAAILCPIAAAMLRFAAGAKGTAPTGTTAQTDAAGEAGKTGLSATDGAEGAGEDGAAGIVDPRLAAPILLAVGWGSGIGGFGSPIGGAANLVAISYIEQLTGTEFMYVDWVVRFLPILFIIFLLNLFFLRRMAGAGESLSRASEYLKNLYDEFGPMSRGEKIGLLLFAAATLLAFLRPVYAGILPGMKPAYVFLTLGLFTFVLTDEKKEVMLTWKYAESHVMWGMMFLFASGMALGRMLIETGAVDYLAASIASGKISSGLPMVAAFSVFGCLLTELSSNTAAASIALPVVISICQAAGTDPMPYLFITVVAVNCAYILPVSTRAVPVSHGLDASVQIREGLKLALLNVVVVILLGWLKTL